jgi:hypothetical protein
VNERGSVPERLEASEPRRIRLALSPQAQRYARRDAPLEARLMAARGALPLPPVELATVLFALLHDPDPEVKATAAGSLEGLPESVLGPVLSGPAHPALLSHLAHVFRESEARLERIALNPATDDATLARLAAAPFKRLVEIVSGNQERMLRCPEIVDALGANPLTGRAVIDRILGFLGIGEAPAAGPEGEPGEAAAEELSQERAEAALRAVLGEELAFAARRLTDESGAVALEGDDPSASGLYALIQQMSVFQKIKLARLGNQEARSLLVRDRNRIVASAAITSPKLTENEVVAIAQSRSVSDEVLRIIANNRTWTRNYKVKHSLVMNPRCPQPMAMKFVNYLQDNDLRSIMRSKDVNANVATHARRILMKKGKL